MSRSLLRELFEAVTRPPDYRVPAGRSMREVSDAEIDAALAQAGLPPCTNSDCDCGQVRLPYRPRHRKA